MTENPSVRPRDSWRRLGLWLGAVILAVSLLLNVAANAYVQATRAGTSASLENALGLMMFVGTSLESKPTAPEQRQMATDVAQAGASIVAADRIMAATGEEPHLAGVGLSLEWLGYELATGRESTTLAKRQGVDLVRMVEVFQGGARPKPGPNNDVLLQRAPAIWPRLYSLLKNAGADKDGPGWG